MAYVIFFISYLCFFFWPLRVEEKYPFGKQLPLYLKKMEKNTPTDNKSQ